MKTTILTLLFAISATFSFAQQGVFNKYIYNKEYDVFMKINLYEETIKIPGQDILGEVYGYLQKKTDARTWIITGVKIEKNGRKATLEIINDYGSEDLTAELSVSKDGVYTLKQIDGSIIKVAGKGKWIKLPKSLDFVTQ